MSTKDQLTDTALIVGATMRLTRLVVTDDLGEWWVKEPLMRRLFPEGIEPVDKAANMRRLGYFQGLDCPWCFGYWAGVLVLGSYHLSGLHPITRKIWRAGASSFTLSYVVGSLSSRLD